MGRYVLISFYENTLRSWEDVFKLKIVVLIESKKAACLPHSLNGAHPKTHSKKKGAGTRCSSGVNQRGFMGFAPPRVWPRSPPSLLPGGPARGPWQEEGGRARWGAGCRGAAGVPGAAGGSSPRCCRSPLPFDPNLLKIFEGFTLAALCMFRITEHVGNFNKKWFIDSN